MSNLKVVDALRTADKEGIPLIDLVTDFKEPLRFNNEIHWRALFHEIKMQDVSDIFFSSGKPIVVRKYGKLYALTKRPLDVTETEFFLLLFSARQNALSEINAAKAINTSWSAFDNDIEKKTNSGQRWRNSYRVNASGISLYGKIGFQITLRAIPADPLLYSDIGLDEAFVNQCTPRTGIVAIAGETGSGKTTTISSIIRYILEHDTPIKGNIITHEEPIEYIYDNIISKHSVVVQSQIPENFPDFSAANREAMRRKPALISVGELRDTETIMAAVEASLTGHPVFATVHSSSVDTILPRLSSRFPKESKETATYDLISCTRMLIAQRLVPTTDGKLMGVREHLEITKDLRNKLLDIGHPSLINAEIRRIMENSEGTKQVSLPFAKQAKQLFDKGLITNEGLRFLTED